MGFVPIRAIAQPTYQKKFQAVRDYQSVREMIYSGSLLAAKGKLDLKL